MPLNEQGYFHSMRALDLATILNRAHFKTLIRIYKVENNFDIWHESGNNALINHDVRSMCLFVNLGFLRENK